MRPVSSSSSYYFVAGIGVNYMRASHITIAPMRTGVGLRAGVNAGYLTFTREETMNPFADSALRREAGDAGAAGLACRARNRPDAMARAAAQQHQPVWAGGDDAAVFNQQFAAPIRPPRGMHVVDIGADPSRVAMPFEADPA